MSGNAVGYARVSTRRQSLDLQVDALVAAGAVRGFQEYASGSTQSRTRWKECLEYLQPGNILVVNDLTRLGRSTTDPSDTVMLLGQRGIRFRSLAEPWLDTTSAHGKLIIDMFAPLRSMIAPGFPNAHGLGWRRPRPEAGWVAGLGP